MGCAGTASGAAPAPFWPSLFRLPLARADGERGRSIVASAGSVSAVCADAVWAAVPVDDVVATAAPDVAAAPGAVTEGGAVERRVVLAAAPAVEGDAPVTSGALTKGVAVAMGAEAGGATAGGAAAGAALAVSAAIDVLCVLVAAGEGATGIEAA